MPKFHPLPILIFLIFSIVLIAIASYVNQNAQKKNIENFFHRSGNIFSPKENTEEKIAKLITNTIKSQSGRWAVYVKDLNRSQTYEINTQEIFPSASLYKLAVMYKTYDELENGRIQKDTSVSGNKTELDSTLQGLQNKEELNDREQEVISYNVSEALRLMITVSDNYSALTLAQYLGWQQIDSLMEKEGFANIDLVSQDSPTVSAKAVGDLLERIYSNKAVSANASEEMKQLLFAQKINDRIPEYLPNYAKVGHKTGELDGVRHDAGIVYGKNSNYIFVFLTDTKDPIGATEQIAQLAKTFFEELERQ